MQTRIAWSGIAIGDLVYLELQQYIQSSMAPGSNQKLAYCFFGAIQNSSKDGFCSLQVVSAPLGKNTSGHTCFLAKEACSFIHFS